jgi:hypothetical protein
MRSVTRAQQPGKHKPAGNPPSKPDPDKAPPIEEPPQGIPSPSENDEPPPMQV